MSSPRTPIVLVCGNRLNDVGGTPAHVVRDTYIEALARISNVQSLLIPATGEIVDPRGLLSMADGLLLTGGASHMTPARYGAKLEFPESNLDPARDSTAFTLLEAALEADIPVMTICRGFQELNVFLGGTLHQKLQEISGKNDHRPKDSMTVLENFRAQAHKVSPQKGGLLERWGVTEDFLVNSLHEQGVDKVGRGLRVEAISDDNTVESVSLPGKRFVVGTQWHPEGDYPTSAVSRLLFQRFGEAVRDVGAMSCTAPAFKQA